VSVVAELMARADVARIAACLGRHTPRTIESDESVRRAAIALVLRPHDDDALELLLIKRAEFEGDPWSGHVAFPGGRSEPGDISLEQTALRETWEETGIDLSRDGVVLGQLDDLGPRTPSLPPILVRPYVTLVQPDVAVTPSDEVALAFWVPLPALMHPGATVESMVTARGATFRVPSYLHDGHVVWGLTERILRQFLDLVG
jgi:8-oxo-dGTP pyrophosphatase MutT (NUDIX family)